MPSNGTGKQIQIGKKYKSFYSGPQVLREIFNDLNFVIKGVKTKKTKMSSFIESNVLTVEVLPLIKKKLTRQKVNRDYLKMTLQKTTILWKLK